MHKKLRFPLRFKILLSQLLVVSVVLSLITFTMAKLFDVDKTAYIHDLTSTMVLHAGEEANALLVGYRERLKLFSRIISEDGMDRRQEVLKRFFEEFGEFVMVTRSTESGEETVFDAAALAASGVTKDEMLRFREAHPVPAERAGGEPYVANSTVSPKLPTLTLTIWEPAADGEEAVTTSGVIRLDKLLRLARPTRVFEIFLLDAQGQFLVHSEHSRIATQAERGWWGRVNRARSPGVTMEYQDRARGMVGGFAKVACGGLTAGVQIPKSAAYLTSRQLLGNLLTLSLILLAAAALLSLFWSHQLTRPIEKLSEATRMVGQGRFEIEIKNDSGDEIGALAGSFNRMAS